jgi:hypothetical protein
MEGPKCAAGIVGYLTAQVSIASIELSAHLAAYSEPTKERVQEVIDRLEKTLKESDEYWRNRS